MKVNLPKLYTQVGNQTPIGNSTIDKIGCLTVDASVAATYFGHAIDPSTLAKSVTYAYNLPNNQGSRTLWIWSELSRLFPDIVYKGIVNTPQELTKAQMDSIRSIIDNGFPVFLQIDVVPSTNQLDEHWVLAVDYDGDDFKVFDPLTGTIHRITDWGIKPQLLIWAYAWYSGKLPVTPAPPSTDDYKKKIQAYFNLEISADDVIKFIEDRKKEINTLNGAIATKDTKIKLLTEKIDSFKSKVTNYVNGL